MELRTDTAYTHPSFRGVALAFVGYATNRVPIQYLTEDEEGNEVWADSDESEEEEDTDRAVVVMIGDDRHHTVDAEDLTELAEDAYCPGCGQTGCHCYR